MRTLIALLLASVTATVAALDCDKAISTPEINACASQEQEKAEARLNKVYRRVLKNLDHRDDGLDNYSEMKKTLVEAQRAWVKFREADCNAVYTRHASGTIRGVMFIGCMQAHAEQRIKELEQYDAD
jgi:uncharacterized protein YecT (DUF1311 family)